MANHNPEDKTPKEKQCGPIYHIICNDDRKHTYVGESKWPLGVGFKEHTKLDRPTGVGEHCHNTGHSVSITNTKVLERKLDWHRHKVKEAIHIRQRCPTMNRDQGYQLPPIYDKIIPPMSNTGSKVSTIYYYLVFMYSLFSCHVHSHRGH